VIRYLLRPVATTCPATAVALPFTLRYAGLVHPCPDTLPFDFTTLPVLRRLRYGLPAPRGVAPASHVPTVAVTAGCSRTHVTLRYVRSSLRTLRLPLLLPLRVWFPTVRRYVITALNVPLPRSAFTGVLFTGSLICVLALIYARLYRLRLVTYHVGASTLRGCLVCDCVVALRTVITRSLDSSYAPFILCHYPLLRYVRCCRLIT